MLLNHLRRESSGLIPRDSCINNSKDLANSLGLAGAKPEAALFRVGGYLKKGGAPKDVTAQVLGILAESCQPPIPEDQLAARIEAAYQGQEDQEKSLAQAVREWVLSSPGDMLSSDFVKEAGLSSRVVMKNVSKIFERLCREGIIERASQKRGHFRLVERESKALNWKDADCSQVFDIQWPFFLENFVNLYPKNIAILAGTSNAGKSAFLLNLVRMNMAKHRVVYFSSEMGEEELRLRISKFGLPLDDWTFEARERASNFAHAIEPDALNIVDFLELSDNFYQVGGDIRAIFDRLNRGVCIIALQKKGGQTLGRGAEFSLEKARVYLSMDPGKLTIIKGKNWALPGFNPNGRAFEFKLVDGCQFVSTKAMTTHDDTGD